MARSIQDIQADILQQVAADDTLNSRLTSTSKTAIWQLFVYVFSYAGNVLERLYDTLVTEITDIIATQKPHTLRWYVSMLKNFQYGYSLPLDTDVYDNSGLSADTIAASKIVAYAAGSKQRRPSGRLFLRLKLAKLVAGDLAPVSNDEMAAVDDYVFRIADAGVDYELTSGPADKIVQTWTVYYDPELLTAAGDRIDGTVAAPVRTAIKNYLKNLPFNGEYRTTYHVDAVQAVSGVTDCKLELCQARYGSLPLTSIYVSYTPDAGYMRFENDADLVINYIPLSPIQ